MNILFPIIVVLLLGSVVYAGVSDQQVVMEIKGMTCEMCPIAIKKALTEV